MTDCECPLAGFCERHKIKKNEHWHRLCQTRENYFQAWESGRGPGTTQPKPAKDRGLGDTVARVLKRIGIKKTKGCGCNKRQAALNRLVPYRQYRR